MTVRGLITKFDVEPMSSSYIGSHGKDGFKTTIEIVSVESPKLDVNLSKETEVILNEID